MAALAFEFPSSAATPSTTTTFTVKLPDLTAPATTPTPLASWKQWKEAAANHPDVLARFKPDAKPTAQDFSLRLPFSGEVVGPDSVWDITTPDRDFLARVQQESAPITLLYTPRVHVCSFDGLDISIPCHGQWLLMVDYKAATAGAGRPPNDMPANNVGLVNDANQADLGKLLSRAAVFMKDELGLGSDAYVISVAFGAWATVDGDAQLWRWPHVKVQLRDPRVFWTLLCKFESKLADGTPAEQRVRLETLAHQRSGWTETRFAHYRQWATRDADVVSAWLARGPPPPPATPFRLPKGFLWDDYGRMLISYKLPVPVSEMLGAMGAVTPKLKTFVRAVQTAAQMTESTSLYLSVNDAQCSILLPVDRYMNILTQAGADASAWGLALQERLKEAPERMYSGLLMENPGLVPCSADDLAKIDEALRALAAPKLPGAQKSLGPVVDASVLPLSVDCIVNVEGRNRTEKRLAADRSGGDYAPVLPASLMPAGFGAKPGGARPPTVGQPAMLEAKPAVTKATLDAPWRRGGDAPAAATAPPPASAPPFAAPAPVVPVVTVPQPAAFPSAFGGKQRPPQAAPPMVQPPPGVVGPPRVGGVGGRPGVAPGPVVVGTTPKGVPTVVVARQPQPLPQAFPQGLPQGQAFPQGQAYPQGQARRSGPPGPGGVPAGAGTAARPPSSAFPPRQPQQQQQQQHGGRGGNAMMDREDRAFVSSSGPGGRRG